MIGRERLEPLEGANILASFQDGSAAFTRHQYGKGSVYVAGIFPGLEYSAETRRRDFDMRRDFMPDYRAFVSAPALNLTKPVVSASAPLVEGVLLENKKNGLKAITLANWAYGVKAFQEGEVGWRSTIIENLPARDLRVTVRGAGKVNEVRSCMLDKNLPFQTAGESIVVTLPII